ncbi:hypothetical protein [Vibrio coralliilyticus]|nr:hypothetical protein [Vibrio coralliilyticus]MCC2525585.1 general secretion pathway protein GspB [Vibrio coralliilyticus]
MYSSNPNTSWMTIDGTEYREGEWFSN